MSTDEDFSEFDAGDDFDAPPEFYPFAQAQQWGVLCPGLSTGALAAYVFICVHLNLSTGKLTAKFGRKRIAERFGVVLKTVDRWLAELVDAGLLEKRPMWWVDKKTGKRSSQPLTADGAKREQAPNHYRLLLAPPGGMAYAGPIHVGEFYQPKLIEERISDATSQGVGTSVSLPLDQRESEKPQVGPQRHVCRPGRDIHVAGVGTYMSPKQERRELPREEPANHRSGTAPAVVPVEASPGWLDGPPLEPQAPSAPTAGVWFLRSLPVQCRPDEHAIRRLAPKVEQLLAGEWSESDLLRRLTGNIDGVYNAPGVVVRRLMDLPLPKGVPKPSRPPWCGECDEHTRLCENDAGQPYWCPQCHPRCAGETRPVS